MNPTISVNIPSKKQTLLEQRIVSTSETLVRSLEEVILGLPTRPDRPVMLARALGLNKDFSSRLMSALRKNDAFAALHTLPGPAPLQQMLDAARAQNVDPVIIDAATVAVEAFAELIQTEFEARSGLDALLSASLPDARERYELTAKQAIYRGQVGIKGVSVDTMLVTFLVGPPNPETQRCDTVVINACYGLRRVRPGAHFEMNTTLRERGNRTEFDTQGTVLADYCSPTPPPMQTVREGDRVRYLLDDKTLGYRSPIDFVTREAYSQNHPLTLKDSDTPSRWFYALVDAPAKTLAFDILIHRDVWLGVDPDLAIFDSAIHGELDLRKDIPVTQRMELAEKVTPLGVGTRNFRSADAPRYIDMLSSAIGGTGWNLDEFRGYRCRVTYPVFGSQVCTSFCLRE